jgi:uncharacterized protein
LKIERPVFLYFKKKYGALNEVEESEYSSVTATDIAEIAEEEAELVRRGVIGVREVKTTLKRTGEIKSLCLNVCHACNLTCSYCFAAQGTYHAEAYMPLKTARAAVDFLIEKSGKKRNLEIDFFGGEPLLTLDAVKAVVEYARGACEKAGKRISFTMTTNGVLLDGETAAYLNETMDNVVISIDGRKAVHDALRKTVNGGGSYDAVIENALRFKKIREKKRYYVRGTFTKNNLDFKEDILALSDAGFDQISLEPVVLEEGNPLAIRTEDVERIIDEYESFAEEYIDRRRTDKWFNFFHFMVDLEKGPCVYKRLNGCGAGDEYAAITPEGDIYPCHQFIGKAEYKMGSVLDGSFDPSVQKIFQNSSVYTKESCGNCFAKYFCSGGCAANSVTHEGNINKTNAVYCALMKKRLELSLGIKGVEKKLKIEN